METADIPKTSSAGELRATVFNIMRYCIHDGPGIRTTVFLKGCPLQCTWCHNPEGQQRNIELSFREDLCVRCGDCYQLCPNGAVLLSGGRYVPVRERCDRCGTCADACCAEARELVGKEMTALEVVDEVLKDRAFFEDSGGGVTFSGGEPLVWPAFLESALRSCRESGLHTAIETSGFCRWEDLAKTACFTNLFLYDLKLMDDEVHRRFTGVGSQLILENLARLSGAGAAVIARIPLIPGINDHDTNLEAAAGFLTSHTRIREVHLLPFHQTGDEKSFRLGREALPIGLDPPSDDRVREAAALFEHHGLHVSIGG